MRKTKLMQRVEERHGAPLERMLPDLLNKQGLTRTAYHLGVSKATVHYWTLKMGLQRTVEYAQRWD